MAPIARIVAALLLAVSPAAAFSPDTCTDMFATMKKLGGPVPPSEGVMGCTEVCAKVHELKEYWGSGEMATFACAQGQKYGCVWPGTPPTTTKDIGC
mmetsp:Transcript_83317/g.212137  ORF Transcript_83317/g.212137 Transcript_83317/m.212137 type:complete len:97 (-) Transcript_83317:117-407(-)